MTDPILNKSPEERQNLASAMRAFARNMQLQDDNLLPAMVVSYDVTNNWATVKPLIQMVDVNDNILDRFDLVQVPCLALGAGNAGGSGNGFVIHFPITQGDFGWIFAADRDISLFKQQLAKTPPNSGRLHQFADAMFVPDIFRRYTIASGDVGRLCIQTTHGDQKITIGTDGHIEITATTTLHVTTPLAEFSANVKIDGNLEVDGTSDLKGAVTAEATMHIEGATSMDSTLVVTGGTTLNGGLVVSSASGGGATLPSNTTIAGKTVNGHTHGGVQTGSGNTAPF